MKTEAKGILLLAALTAGCAILSRVESVPFRHPEELPAGRADCAECHEDGTTGTLKPHVAFRHSSVFLRRHGDYASLGQNLCASCHAADFCQACHARKEELRPDLRWGNRPDLMSPHRGDYLTQHPLDGRMDPGSCLRCHGNRDSGRCLRCHK